MGNTINVGNLVATVSTDTSGLSKGVDELTAATDKMKSSVEKVKTALVSLLTNPVVLAGAAAAALISLGKAAYDAYVELDKAYDAIEVGTGATGKALDSLKESFDNVFANNTYVDSAEELAGVIADLNTYLGVTDDELETLASQISNMQHMGMEASVGNLGAAFNKWGVATDEYSGYLDYFFQVSQNTGVSIDKLTQGLAKSQSYLSQYGFNLEESTELLGRFNKEGYNTEKIEGIFKKLATVGVTTKEGFNEVISSIRNASDETEKLTIAQQYFGENMVEVCSMLENGVFDDFTMSLENSSNAIQNTAKSTESFSDKMERAGRSAQAFMAKAGGVIENVLSKLFDFGEWMQGLVQKLWVPFEKLFAKIGETFSKFWNDGKDTTGNAVDSIAGFIEDLTDKVATMLDWFLEFVWPAVEVFIEYIVDIVKAFLSLISGDTDAFWEYMNKAAAVAMSVLYALLEKGWNYIAEGIEDALQGTVDFIFNAINTVTGFLSDRLNDVIGFVNNIVGGINNVLDFFGLGQISLLGTVDWKVDTPDVSGLVTRFSDTVVGSGMQNFITEQNIQGNGAKSSLIQNITINGDITDAYTVKEAAKTGAVEAMNNPTIARG